jgi:antirestriction protein ArdC
MLPRLQDWSRHWEPSDQASDRLDWPRVETAEMLIDSFYCTPREDIHWELDHRPCCDLDNRVICMPLNRQFKSVDQFYFVLFHEIIHWTSVPLERPLPNFSPLPTLSERRRYAREEFTAEIGAILLSQRAGLDLDLLVPLSASYITMWHRGTHMPLMSGVYEAQQQANQAIIYLTQGGIK